MPVNMSWDTVGNFSTEDTSVNLSFGMNMSNISSVISKPEISNIDIVTIVVQMALSVFIVGGNILTILAVRRTPRLHTVANKYVMSLAVADLIAGVVLPLYAVKHVPGVTEVFDTNKMLCLTGFVVLIISAGNSMVTMVLIAVDRLIYIVYPLRYGRVVTKYKARVVIVISWVFAVFIGTMPYYYNNWENADSCETFEVISMGYQIYIQFLVFCLCCLIAGICYCYIFKISYHQRKSIVMLDSFRKDSGDNGDVRNTFKREWPMIRMFMLVFGVFFVCWCPAMIAIVIGSTLRISPTIMNILVALCLLNSGMNFIIYGVKNRDFRRAYVRLLCGHRLDSFGQFDSSIQSKSGNGLLMT